MTPDAWALVAIASEILSALLRRDYQRAKLRAENLVIQLAAIEGRRKASEGARK